MEGKGWLKKGDKRQEKSTKDCGNDLPKMEATYVVVVCRRWKRWKSARV